MFNKNLIYLNSYKVLLVIIAILLPFTEYLSIQFTSIAIILLFTLWLALSDYSFIYERIKAEKIILLLFLLYLINIQGIFRDNSNGIVEKILLKKISLFLLPLIIGTSPKLKYSFVLNIIIAFVASLIISTLFTYINGVNQFMTTPEGLNDLADKIIIHRPYYGLFCAFSIISLLSIINKHKNFIIGTFLFIIILYFIFYILLIQAKMSLIGLLLSAITLAFLWLFSKRKYFSSFFLIMIILACIGGTYTFSAKARTYTNYIINKKDFSFSDYNILIVGSINVRYVNWGCAYDILKNNNNWLLGVGAGNVQAELQQCYNIRNQWVYENKMNSHNQFIEETLYNGIFGLMIFLSCILVAGFISLKRNNFLHLAFLILFSFCCLTESMLNRQIGIFFFSFFNALLFFNYKNTQSTNI